MISNYTQRYLRDRRWHKAYLESQRRKCEGQMIAGAQPMDPGLGNPTTPRTCEDGMQSEKSDGG